MSVDVQHSEITKSPGVCGGRARIAGHRIRVQDVVIEYEWQGLSPEEICQQHPALSLAEVHAALAYFYAHRDEINAEIEADRQAEAEFRQQIPTPTR